MYHHATKRVHLTLKRLFTAWNLQAALQQSQHAARADVFRLLSSRLRSGTFKAWAELALRDDTALATLKATASQQRSHTILQAWHRAANQQVRLLQFHSIV